MITITVTGESLGEVADKLLAIGASLTRQNPIMPEVAATVTGEVQTQPAKRATKEKPVGETKSPASSAEEPASSETKSPASASPEASSLDFDKDISPAVTGAVAKLGKPAVIAIIEQFGAAKASQIDEARWPELLEALKG